MSLFYPEVVSLSGLFSSPQDLRTQDVSLVFNNVKLEIRALFL